VISLFDEEKREKEKRQSGDLQTRRIITVTPNEYPQILTTVTISIQPP
jgi:hypothetical protein